MLFRLGAPSSGEGTINVTLDLQDNGVCVWGGAYPPRSRAEAAGSLAPRGPGPSKLHPGDLGRAALTSAGCARLLPAGSGDTAR